MKGRKAYQQLAKELFAELEALAEHIRPVVVLSPEQCIDYFKASLINKANEVFSILFLNAKNRVIASEEVAQGTIDQVVIYPREVIKSALKHNATAMIVCHNHPSGECEPSGADIRLTESLNKASDCMDIKLLDHMIIGSGSGQYFSFLEEGLI